MDKQLPNVLLADPPWRYDFAVSKTRRIENQYPTMEIEDICDLKPETADDAILFLWATAPKLLEAIKVMKEWGFTYKTNIVWIKDKIGMGYYARSQHELLLIGTKGKISPPIPENRKSSIINGKRTKHSKKPPIVHSYIERMYPDGIFMEMFARDRREGWGAWGNEVPKTIQCTFGSWTH
ncbi:MAG: MT-A70 family methyltransferase [Candidatus Thorarchaeota archaeon]